MMISGKKMNSHFPKSVLLTQNSTGVRTIHLTILILYLSDSFLSIHSFQHCSLSAPSSCTAKYVRQYFIDGTLPPVDTVCEVDSPMFGETDDDGDDDGAMEAKEVGMSEEDLKMRKLVRDLSDGFEVSRFGLMGW